MAEWDDSGTRSPLFDGVLRGPFERVIRDVLMLVEAWSVRRALVDAHPDGRIAQQFLAIQPEVFGLQSGSMHNAASLAEVAWRRTQPEAWAVALDVLKVVSLEPDALDASRLVARVYVPDGVAAPSHLVVDLAGADVMERADGARIVERVLPMHEIGLAVAGEPVQGSRMQVWSLAPTTTLPTRGWSLVLSLYANSALIHEQVVTINQMMGLADVTDELAREASLWLERSAEMPGPYVAEFSVFAGATLVYQVRSDDAVSPPALDALVHDKGVLMSGWIRDNAVSVEQEHPGVNLPPDDPMALPPFDQDAYDYER